jgi:hypothetical protein
MATNTSPPLEDAFAERIDDSRSPSRPHSTALPTPSHRLRDVALAAIASIYPSGSNSHPAASELLLHEYLEALGGHTWQDALEQALLHATPEDAPLAALARELEFSPAEQLLIALAAAVEEDPFVGRALAFAQAPVGSSRPTLGLATQAFAPLFNGETQSILICGNAVRCGMLVILNDNLPLPERPVLVPPPLCLALAGQDHPWPDMTLDLDRAAVPLPDPMRAEASRHAAALLAEPDRALLLRSGFPDEARAVAAEVAKLAGRRPLFIQTDKLAGLGPWLQLRACLPVFCFQLAPGERKHLPTIPGYHGPALVVCGPDGSVELERGSMTGWTLPVPAEEERLQLWRNAIGPTPAATTLAAEHRHSAGRIAELGRLACHQAALSGHAEPDIQDIAAASWLAEGSGVESLAEPLRTTIPDDALVLSEQCKSELQSLLLRCRFRDNLTAGLGLSSRTRYRPGVRALFTGPSGTGKTLAAGWVATRLQMPLYRVDLAAVTSKYIGETEKNLSQLLARAEQAEVILLFDEADSLFGKRTDIKDSNDRFANAQTNYLLQRIENYDGIVLLTSNSQVRFDSAFARRLDFIIEFTAPAALERRALWQSHLGPNCRISPQELNELSALVDFNGGHIRNVVLAAAVKARAAERPITCADLLRAARGELRKLGQQLPVELSRRLDST